MSPWHRRHHVLLTSQNWEIRLCQKEGAWSQDFLSMDAASVGLNHVFPLCQLFWGVKKLHGGLWKKIISQRVSVCSESVQVETRESAKLELGGLCLTVVLCCAASDWLYNCVSGSGGNQEVLGRKAALILPSTVQSPSLKFGMTAKKRGFICDGRCSLKRSLCRFMWINSRLCPKQVKAVNLFRLPSFYFWPF